MTIASLIHARGAQWTRREQVRQIAPDFAALAQSFGRRGSAG